MFLNSMVPIAATSQVSVMTHKNHTLPLWALLEAAVWVSAESGCPGCLSV